MWVFGYGSLIFRPNFDWDERRVGYVEGWARRFWQGSTDHRGVPGSPGRVVTLVTSPGTRCWGVAYRVEGAAEARVLAELDHREKGGYGRLVLDVVEQATGTVIPGVLTYIGTAQNPNYLGPAETGVIARQILRAHGPSGANLDYLLRLAEALREIGVDDPHVFDLEAAVLAQSAGSGPRPEAGRRDADS